MTKCMEAIMYVETENKPLLFKVHILQFQVRFEKARIMNKVSLFKFTLLAMCCY